MEKIVAKSSNLSQAKEKEKVSTESDKVKLDIVVKEPIAKVADSPDIRQEPVEPKPPDDDGTEMKKPSVVEKVLSEKPADPPVVAAVEDPAKEVGSDGEIVVKKEIIEEVIKEEVQAKVKEAQMEIEAAKEEHEVKVKEKEEELQNREEKAEKLLQELEKQKIEQKQIIKEQKEVLKAMKEHVEGDQDVKRDEEQLQPLDRMNEHEIQSNVIAKEGGSSINSVKISDNSDTNKYRAVDQPNQIVESPDLLKQVDSDQVPVVSEEILRKHLEPKVIIGEKEQHEIPYKSRSSLKRKESNIVDYRQNMEQPILNHKPYRMRGSAGTVDVQVQFGKDATDSREGRQQQQQRPLNQDKNNPSRDLKSVKAPVYSERKSNYSREPAAAQRVKRDEIDALDSLMVDDDKLEHIVSCLLYTSPSPRDRQKSRMPSSA